MPLLLNVLPKLLLRIDERNSSLASRKLSILALMSLVAK